MFIFVALLLSSLLVSAASPAWNFRNLVRYNIEPNQIEGFSNPTSNAIAIELDQNQAFLGISPDSGRLKALGLGNALLFILREDEQVYPFEKFPFSATSIRLEYLSLDEFQLEVNDFIVLAIPMDANAETLQFAPHALVGSLFASNDYASAEQAAIGMQPIISGNADLAKNFAIVMMNVGRGPAALGNNPHTIAPDTFAVTSIAAPTQQFLLGDLVPRDNQQ